MPTIEKPRPLTEDEKWGPPKFDRVIGWQIRLRVACEHGSCAKYANYLVMGKKICGTHFRQFLRR